MEEKKSDLDFFSFKIIFFFFFARSYRIIGSNITCWTYFCFLVDSLKWNGKGSHFGVWSYLDRLVSYRLCGKILKKPKKIVSAPKLFTLLGFPGITGLNSQPWAWFWVHLVMGWVRDLIYWSKHASSNPMASISPRRFEAQFELVHKHEPILFKILSFRHTSLLA